MIVNILSKIEVDKTMLSLFKIAICLGNISEHISTIIVMIPVDKASALFPYLSRTNFVVRALAVMLAILFPIRIVVTSFDGFWAKLYTTVPNLPFSLCLEVELGLMMCRLSLMLKKLLIVL